MTLMESPSRLVMAGSYESYEPAITKRIGDSRGVMTKPSVTQAFLRFDLDLWLYLGTGLLVFTRFWNVIYIKYFPVDTDIPVLDY